MYNKYAQYKSKCARLSWIMYTNVLMFIINLYRGTMTRIDLCAIMHIRYSLHGLMYRMRSVFITSESMNITSALVAH